MIYFSTIENAERSHLELWFCCTAQTIIKQRKTIVERCHKYMDFFFICIFPASELLCNENIFNSDATKLKNIRYTSWESIGDVLEDGKLMTWQRFKERYNISCMEFKYNILLCYTVYRMPLKIRCAGVISNHHFPRDCHTC